MEKKVYTKQEKLNLTKGLIYKIYSLNKPYLIYIGSTSSSLKDRLQGHKRSYERWKKDKKNCYLASFEILKYENVVIEKLDKIYYEDKSELLRLEGHYQRKIPCVNIVTNNDQIKTNNYIKNEKVSKIPIEQNIFKNFLYTS